MESQLRTRDGSVRLSNSPGRSPQITQGLKSPAQSVHPEMQGLESIHSQADFGHRTTDFFDDNSDDDIPTAGSVATDGQDINLLGRTAVLPSKRQRRSPEQDLVSQCDVRKSVTNPDAEGYQRLEPRGTQDEHIRFADTPATSFNGSVTELLSGGDHSSPPRRLSGAQVADGTIGRSSPHFDRFNEQHGSSPQPQNEQVLAAHAIAHEITLQALMRDEETLDRTLQSFAPLNGGARASLLPSSLKPHDPRSPRHQTFTSPKSLASSKKVHIVPAPIDTSAPRRSLPADIVRTPYPHIPGNVYRKDLGRSPPSAHSIPSPHSSESLLTVSIRRSNRHSRARVTSITIPAPNAFSATRARDSDGKPRHHLRADKFDDAQFFQHLRSAYCSLLGGGGPLRHLSARSLHRIVVSGAASRAADAGYGWLYQPRSPRLLAHKGLSDPFGEEKILQHFRHPAQGRARYAFVHWAHRLAAAAAGPSSPVHTPQAQGERNSNVEAGGSPPARERDLVRRIEQPEGLEFVMGWSWRRIGLVFLSILATSVAAALVWIFLGRDTPAAVPSQGGFRGAGDRVAAGAMMGICLLLLGLSSMAAWLGVSWLVM